MSLDFESEEFDPALALAAVDISLPDPDAKPLNNLSEYVNAMRGNPNKGVRKENNKPTTSREEQQATAKNPIRFDSYRPRTRIKNVLSIMENIKGPLGSLRNCMDQSIRVKVWIRRGHEMRGVCQGYVLAFDRHWNIALRDVDETYVLPKWIKTPPGGEEREPAPGPGVHCHRDLAVIARRHQATGQPHKDKRTVRQRHVDQLFIRGDGVAFVSLGDRVDQQASTSSYPS